jgi:hypothetical protein
MKGRVEMNKRERNLTFCVYVCVSMLLAQRCFSPERGEVAGNHCGGTEQE